MSEIIETIQTEFNNIAYTHAGLCSVAMRCKHKHLLTNNEVNAFNKYLKRKTRGKKIFYTIVDEKTLSRDQFIWRPFKVEPRNNWLSKYKELESQIELCEKLGLKFKGTYKNRYTSGLKLEGVAREEDDTYTVMFSGSTEYNGVKLGVNTEGDDNFEKFPGLMPLSPWAVLGALELVK
jgi:hypothetical protein